MYLSSLTKSHLIPLKFHTHNSTLNTRKGHYKNQRKQRRKNATDAYQKRSQENLHNSPTYTTPLTKLVKVF